MTRNARIVTVPSPHAGIGKSLRACFASPPRLPDDWQRMLDRLG